MGVKAACHPRTAGMSSRDQKRIQSSHESYRGRFRRNRRIHIGGAGARPAAPAVEVRVVMTAAAQKFVQPLTFAALTGHRSSPACGMGHERSYSEQNGIDHISRGTMGRCAGSGSGNGQYTGEVCPRDRGQIFFHNVSRHDCAGAGGAGHEREHGHHPATQAKPVCTPARGLRVVEPGTGELACGMVGVSHGGA